MAIPFGEPGTPEAEGMDCRATLAMTGISAGLLPHFVIARSLATWQSILPRYARHDRDFGRATPSLRHCEELSDVASRAFP